MRVRLRRQAPAPAPAQPRPRFSRCDDFRDEERLRAAGAPEDTCLYSCSCGYVFEAAVTTSVRCPHCGDSQAW